MKRFFILLFLLLNYSVFAQSSMRRCTLLPITDSVGGAIGFKVFEQVETELKNSNWCTYISNSNLINVFSRYRENLPQYLKSKEVLTTVSEKLKVGSLILVSLKNEINGIDAEIKIYAENGEDLYFSEKASLKTDEIEIVSQTINNWLEVYAKTIPYDAKINGVLGDQITLDVGKGYPINVSQKYLIKRPIQTRKHPLLKKIVDWETLILAEGKIFNISDNQALGIIKAYKGDKKVIAGDWVRLEEFKEEDKEVKTDDENKANESPGTLGVLSLALFGSSSSVDTKTPTDSNRMSGNIFGVDLRVEGWITRDYFAAIEIERALGSLKETSGNPTKSSVNVNNSTFKLNGGYKYLPIGFFYGPQIDVYAGYVKHTFDLDVSETDGFGKNSISGIVLGTAVNIPLNREYRFVAQAEFIPLPTFSEEDSIYGSAQMATSMELEIGLKYQYTTRMTIDGTIETISNKARFGGTYKEVSYKDNRLKVGLSFNF
jgi:hypothetical protein